jgi:hypothetical protein
MALTILHCHLLLNNNSLKTLPLRQKIGFFIKRLNAKYKSLIVTHMWNEVNLLNTMFAQYVHVQGWLLIRTNINHASIFQFL